jgi:hypothetical protein
VNLVNLSDPRKERMCQTGDSNGGSCRILMFWNMTPCTLGYRERSFGVYCPYLHGSLLGQKCLSVHKGTQATQPFIYVHCLPIGSWPDKRATQSTTNHRLQSIAVSLFELVTTNFMEQSAFHTLIVPQMAKKFPEVYGTRRPQDRVHKIPLF